MYTTVLLTELALNAHDAARVASLHEGEQLRVHVVVPADTEHNRLVAQLDDIALGEFQRAVRERERVAPDDVAGASAREAASVSAQRLQASGVEATGDIADDDPLPTVERLVGELQADEVLVFTLPHMVEDTLHRDWASRLRKRVHVPVLHAIAGTDRVVG